MSRTVCVACRHQIDAAARLCPYCGADPETGQKVDTQAILQEVFQPRHVSTAEGVMQYARQRQGVVITLATFAVLLLLSGVHQFASRRNQRIADANAVPLTEVTDLSNQSSDTRPQPLPEMQFQYDGHAQTMRTFVVEPGAVTPPEVVAAQAAATATAPTTTAAPAPPPPKK